MQRTSNSRDIPSSTSDFSSSILDPLVEESTAVRYYYVCCLRLNVPVVYTRGCLAKQRGVPKLLVSKLAYRPITWC